MALQGSDQTAKVSVGEFMQLYHCLSGVAWEEVGSRMDGVKVMPPLAGLTCLNHAIQGIKGGLGVGLMEFLS
jgi:hypothetical protein